MAKSDRPSTPRLPLTLIASIAGLAVLAIPLTALLAQTRGSAPFTVVETGEGFARLQDAINRIGDARGTVAIAPGRYSQCAVQERGQISFLATKPGAAIFDGVACEGKAALVLRGRGAEVSGLVFQNIRVPDVNGAGIRLEKSDLTVAQSWFRDSEQGILTAADPSSRLIVDRSTFTRLGTCEGGGGCAHSIYVGNYGALVVTNSRFEQGRGGHYVKSRSASVEIAANSFDDAGGKGTNYMIDLPGGASGRITDNWFVQGPDKENHSAFIAVAAEGKAHDSARLSIIGNDARFAPGITWPSVFVADWSGDLSGTGDNTLARHIKAFERR